MNTTDMKKMTDSLANWRSDLNEPHRRGAKAELRRCKSLTEVIMTPTYQRLCSRLGLELDSFSKHDKERLAFIVGLLSHVREVSKSKLAKAMAAGTPSCVSELRFRRLLQHDSDDRFYAAMIRVIRMLKYQANVYDLIESMYYWNDDKKKRLGVCLFFVTSTKRQLLPLINRKSL